MKTAASSHSHDLAEVDAAIAALEGRIDAELEALEARIAALEGVPEPPPDPDPPPTGKVVEVASIVDLKAALSDDVDEIVLRNGTYRVAPAGNQSATSLWIGDRYAGRTRPVLVRAETKGGVILDGGGARYFGGLWFEDGADYQTWEGFGFANGEATNTGVIVFGAWADKPAAHHITLRDIAMAKTLTTHTGPGDYHDHGIYFSQAMGGVSDVLVDGLTVDGSASNSLDSALHFYHSEGAPNARNVTVRRLKVTGTEMAIILWDKTIKNIVIEDATITNATRFAVRYEEPGTAIVLRRVKSTGSGQGVGFYSSKGANPPGLTFEDCDLR